MTQSAPPIAPLRILHTRRAAQAAALAPEPLEAIYPTAPGDGPWDEQCDAPQAELAARFDVNIDAASWRAGHLQLRGGLKLAIWCDAPQQMAALIAEQAEASALILSPSLLTLLDHARGIRQTLILRQPLAAGELLTDAHLTTEANGLGADAALQSSLVGRAAAYDLEAGHVMDLGLLEKGVAS
ncbi:hypothetical protein [Magnetofaba australis]|uniref:Uncharacterized protein n=1 Tax=Magnetofaba australis IT-1 TaxID=1434232 RepID=A0A1Y2JZ14_9PROT|nr:hypothetical protein [Magnetofaba australis]OSM00109.1 hypothetical protein MAIT1_00534 [Magnetofaba australis IT-1]